ncbi:MAG: porin family protein [bacterium]|nr:porin family protein [bacterium]
MKKLILLTLLTTLSLNASASDKQFISFGIGKTKDSVTLNDLGETKLDGSSFSLEYGKFIESTEKDILFAVSGEFAQYNTKKTFVLDDEKDEVKIPTLALNGYVIYSKTEFKPYVGLGLVVSTGEKLNITEISTGDKLSLKSESFNLGVQFKLGGMYAVNEMCSVGVEYKYLNLNSDLDKMNGFDISSELKNKVSTVQLKLLRNF